MKTKRKAASTRLRPGEHSVDRNTPVAKMAPTGRRYYYLQCYACDHSGESHRIQAEASSITEVRDKARRKANEWIDGSRSKYHRWTRDSPIDAYIDIAAREALRSSLAPGTVRRYTTLLKQLRDELAGRTIMNTMHRDVLLSALENIGKDHGQEAARQAKIVLSRYVTGSMITHRLITVDPLQGVRMDLQQFSPLTDKPKRGGQGVTAEQQERTIAYLLDLDPAEGILPPKRGPYTIEDRINRQRTIISLTLFQIGTALRITEALKITRADLDHDEARCMYVNVSKDVAKTKIARTTPIFEPRVQAHIEAWLKRIPDDKQYLFGRPTDPRKFWTASGNGGASQHVARLYQKMARDLDIAEYEHLRTHLWRTTLSSRCAEAGLSREVYAKVLGHTTAVNEKSYTQGVDLSHVLAGYRQQHHPAEPGSSSTGTPSL